MRLAILYATCVEGPVPVEQHSGSISTTGLVLNQPLVASPLPASPKGVLTESALECGCCCIECSDSWHLILTFGSRRCQRKGESEQPTSPPIRSI